MTERKLYMASTADPPPVIYCDDCMAVILDLEDAKSQDRGGQCFTAESLLRKRCDCDDRAGS